MTFQNFRSADLSLGRAWAKHLCARVLLSLCVALFPATLTSAQVSFASTQISLSGGAWGLPSGVAADGKGNIFVADAGLGRVAEISPRGSGFGAPAILISGLSGPTGVAADWMGNVYVADTGNNRILKIPVTSTGFGVALSIATGLSSPTGIAVDSAGNVYVADTGSNSALEIPFSAGIYGIPVLVGSGFSHPLGITVDTGMNLYIADTGNSRIVKEPFTGGGYSTQVVYWKGLYTPVGVYVDSSLNLYLADSANRRVVEEPWEAGAGRYNSQVVLGSGFDSPAGVVADTKGIVYVADSANDDVVQIVPASVSFGGVDAGSTASLRTFNFTVTAGTTIGSVNVETQGVTGKDFFDAGGSSCVPQAYSSTIICGVNVAFKPLGSGTRMGAVVLSDSSGHSLASAFISGIGIEPQVAFIPGIMTVVGSGFNAPGGVAVDGNGNVYISDTGNNRVVKLPWTGNGYGQQVMVPITGLASPLGLALDGGGNLYVASNENDKVVRLAWTGSSFGTQSNVGSGLYGPSGVAVDATGDVFIADTLDERVDELVWTGSSFETEAGIGNYHKGPIGVAVDGSGNVYFTDPYQNQISESPFTGAPTAEEVGVPATGLSFPIAVAADGNSNLYVLDSLENKVVLIPWIGTGFGSQITVATGFNSPSGLAVDGNGNLYVADTGNNQVVKIQLSVPATMSFANTYLGSTSADSPRTAAVENIGNQALSVSTVKFPSDFPENAGETDGCAGSTSLGPGQRCELAVEFTPLSVGSPLSEEVSLSVSAPSLPTTQQLFPVNGTSLARSPQTISFPAIPSLAFGAAPIALGVTASSGLSVTLTVLSGPGKIGQGQVLNIYGVGTLVLQAIQAGDAAFEAALPVQVSVTVAPAKLTVTPIDKSVVYGTIPTSFGYSITGFVQGETPSMVVTGKPTITSGAVGTSGAGTYALIASQGTLAAANYTFAFAPGVLTISKASLQVQASSFSRVYGSPMGVLPWKLGGFVNGDTASVVTGVPTVTTVANSGSPVGSYPVLVSIGTLAAANYSFTPVAGTITVTPAVLTVMGANQATIYGEGIPVLEYWISGFMNGDTPSDVVHGAPVLSTTASANASAGNYAISPGPGTLSAMNYKFAFVPGVLSVKKASILVSPANASSTYGSKIPTLTYTLTGFVIGDTAASSVQGAPAISTSANSGSAAGTYLITAALGSLQSKNYSFLFANALLAICKTILTVAPKPVTMVYGGNLPPLSAVYSGFVNGDGPASLQGAPQISTAAKATSPVGAYMIKACAGSLNSKNYSFVFATAVFTITKAALVVTADNLSVTVGSPIPSLIYSVSGLVNGDTAASATTGSPAISTTANTTKAGKYPIMIADGNLSATNYQLTFVNGTLTVTPSMSLYVARSSIVSRVSE